MKRAATLLAGMLAALFLLEAAARVLDGFRLWPPRLPALPPALLDPPVRVLPASGWAHAAGAIPPTEARWIDAALPPLLPPRRPAPELLAIRDALAHRNVAEHDLYNVWNRRHVDEVACSTFNVLPLLPQPIRVFDPPQPSRHPPYRHLPGCTTPTGLVTNRFGFRGPEVDLDKSPRTVRLAFAGASTTIGIHFLPHAYPEYVVHWLNLWSERERLGVRFEAINVGRGGLGSADIAAVVESEALPFEPDLVVYYEGANQFVFADPAARGAGLGEAPRAPAWRRGWKRFVAATQEWSNLVRRLDRRVRALAASGGEPAKPPLRWPLGEHEEALDLTNPQLPLGLSTVLSDLERIRSAASARGAELAVSSFVWLGSEGMRLDPARDFYVYEVLNEKYWPLRYGEIRRLADFQNRVLQRYAAQHGLVFLDVARRFPQDPELFFDPIHFNWEGTRLHAWIVLQELIPHVRERLAGGRWPRADREPLSVHPHIGPVHEHPLPCAR